MTPSTPETPIRNVLVTGATGYVGGRLIPRLLDAGYNVRALARDPARLQGRPWSDRIEVVEGDVLDPDTLPAAMDGIDAAYYMIHSMGSSGAFEERDVHAARNFGEAAAAAGVQRILYLGGLGDPEADLSNHLRSRQVTVDTLREAGVPVTEFRAAIIVGSGSTSFEMIRYLTERVPVMICPQWVYTRVQPIAIRNVLAYLIAALETPASAGEIIEIGGDGVLAYADMMTIYAEERGLRRALVPVPVLTPRLSSYWVHWVTPIPATIARPLIDGLRNEVIVRDDKARRLFPAIHPLSYREAVQLALRKLDAQEVETAWTDALLSSQGDRRPVVLAEREGMIIERRQRHVDASPHDVYQTMSRLGGATGWLAFNWAWLLRGVLDRMVGGVGFRRGRRDPEHLRVGDALDFWRVERADPDECITLRAEMKVPGRAWLQFEVEPEGNGSTFRQTAFFAPKGLFGLLYWYLLYPFHGPIFSQLADGLKARAEQMHLQAEIPSAVDLNQKDATSMKTQIKKPQARTQVIALGLALFAPFLTAFIGGAATGKSIDDWYVTLNKPRWNPPNWLFPTAWTFLYTVMGIASWLVWRAGRNGRDQGLSTNEEAQSALKLYGVHLIFNALWSVIFFGMRKLGWAIAEIAVLWSLVVATAARFYQIKPIAGLMFIPYILWASFAAILNITVWRMNRKQ